MGPAREVDDDDGGGSQVPLFTFFCHWAKQKGVLWETCQKLNQ